MKNEEKNISEEISLYDKIDNEIKKLKPEDVKELELEIEEIEILYEENKEKIQSINEKIYTYSTVEKQVEKSKFSLSNLDLKLDDNSSKEIVKDIDSLIYEIDNIIKEKIGVFEVHKSKLIKENKGLNNKLAVKGENLISIKTKITTLGLGDLEDGWAEIERYNELIKEEKLYKSRIQRKERYAEAIETEANTSLQQVLTASLSNLQKSHLKHFRDFMTSTIQMMGGYFAKREIDDNHPLYETFIEWNNRKNIIKLPKRPPTDPTINEEGRNVRKEYLIMQSMKKPYIKLDMNSLLIRLIIPEQDFTFRQDIDERPYYGLIDKEGNTTPIKIDYGYRDGNLYIKETEVIMDPTSYEYLLFNWYNLREIHDISLDGIGIFDHKGNFINKNKVRNGYYYIVCENHWFIKEDTVIEEYKLSYNHKIFEVKLNESKIELYTENKNKTYSFIATDYGAFKLDNYNIIEGVYCNELPVVVEYMPQLLINQLGVDLDLIYLEVFLEDNLVYRVILKDVLGEYSKDSIISISIYKLLGLKNIATKVKILLVHEDDRELLNEEFYFLPKVKFKYIDKGLNVKIQRGIRFSSSIKEQKNMECTISLENKNGEEFSIYYNHHGWVKLWVEVPILDMRIIHNEFIEYSQGDALYGSRREELKNLFVECKTNSERIKSILLFDNEGKFWTKIHMKNKHGKISLEPFYDILAREKAGQVCYRAEDNNILIEEGIILETYEKWELSNIKVSQTEKVDEFILGIEYDENFAFRDQAYLEILNENRSIIKKEIKDQIYIYIKKKDLSSNNIKINILYYEKFDDIFGGIEEEKIIAGSKEIKLKSKINEINKILANGILITRFEYKGKDYEIKKPVNLEIVERADSRNFKGEEMYKSRILSNNAFQRVYFYIDTEKKVLPFLIDEDMDGAQYNPKDGRIFWEINTDPDIKGPLEGMTYTIKEEK